MQIGGIGENGKCGFKSKDFEQIVEDFGEKNFRKYNLYEYCEDCDWDEYANVLVLKNGIDLILGPNGNENLSKDVENNIDLLKKTFSKYDKDLEHDKTKVGGTFKYKTNSKYSTIFGTVVGGKSFLRISWHKNAKKVGRECKITLNPGDIYILSEKVVGLDWRKRELYTLRNFIHVTKPRNSTPPKNNVAKKIPTNTKTTKTTKTTRNTKTTRTTRTAKTKVVKNVSSVKNTVPKKTRITTKKPVTRKQTKTSKIQERTPSPKNTTTKGLKLDEYGNREYLKMVKSEFPQSQPAIQGRMPNHYTTWGEVYMALKVCSEPKKELELGAKIDIIYQEEEEIMDENDMYVESITYSSTGKPIQCKLRYLNAHVGKEDRTKDYVKYGVSKNARWVEKEEKEYWRTVVARSTIKLFNVKNIRVNPEPFEPNFSFVCLEELYESCKPKK